MFRLFILKKFLVNTFKNLLFSFMALGMLLGVTTPIKADLVQDNINLIKKLSNEQDLIANTIELYIELYGVNPTNINQLKSTNLLSNTYTPTYFNGFSVNANSITINSSFPNYETYQKDFYLNDFSRNRVTEPSITSNTFTTKFFLSKESLNTLSYVGVVDFITPNAPTSASANKSWYDTRKKKIFYYIGGNWITLDAKKLWIVKSLSELSSLATTGATENDGGIVLTPTSLDKYLFVSNQWHKIENVPYNYNTGF